MENVIKGLHKLAPDEIEEVDKLEYAGLMHRRHNNITFKIVEVTDKQVSIQAAQGKNPSGNYFNKKRLIELVHEVFDRHIIGKRIVAHAIPYEESPVDTVDEKWIQSQMLETGTKLKDIVRDTGLNNTQLSTMLNGGKPFSQVMKAMFYFYFMSKKGLS